MTNTEHLKAGVYSIIGHLSITNKIQIIVPFPELEKAVNDYAIHVLSMVDKDELANKLMKASIDFKGKN